MSKAGSNCNLLPYECY